MSRHIIDPDWKRKADKEDAMLEQMDAVRRRYYIVRQFKDEDKTSRVVKRNLSLEQAQAHCRRPDTICDEWCDGYERSKS
jgi:hypothetical protein